MAYTHAQVFTFESQLSQMERVLFVKIFFHIRWAVIGQSEARDTVDKQHREVKCEAVVRRKGFYANLSAEMLLYCIVLYSIKIFNVA